MFRQNQGEKEQCTFCDEDGHNEDGCFKVIGYPDWWPGKDRKGKQRPRTIRVEGELWPYIRVHEASKFDKEESFFMHDIRSGTLIGTGKCQNGLYKMEMVKKRHALATSAKKFSGFTLLTTPSPPPFPVSTTKTHACFDLIHCDIWGKYRTPSLTRASYFLTIVDDFSRATWVYLLKQKHEASMCLKAFHKMVQVQFEKNIRRIRCDNGGEFISNQMIEFYANQGIILETSCIHTPQQNGVVERKHRHLLETARALRFEANLPTRFWGECVLTAAYVINRMPSDVIGNKTPYEVEEEEIFIPPSIWDDEVIEEKPKDLIGEPNETEIGHSEPIEEFEDDLNNTKPRAPSEIQTEVELSQKEVNMRTRPTYLDDYEVQLPPSIDHKQPTSSRESSTVHSLAHYVSYDNFTNTHKAFLSAITSNNEPKHFQQAIQDPRWIEAMKKEIQALEQNKTWTLEELPNGKKAIDSKWVYKIKYKPNGDVVMVQGQIVQMMHTNRRSRFQ
ncbi:retrovirus-related pol polyprotein from transposon TNT 1-94 [Tanacetum coccineum]